MNVWDFAERRAAILPAVQKLVQEGRIPSPILVQIEELYAQHRDFAAERLAGLAIWVGKGVAEDTLATFFEHFGIVLREIRNVSSFLQKAEVLQSWTCVASSRDEYIRVWGMVSPAFYERFLRLERLLFHTPADNVTARGTAIRRSILFLAGQGELPLPAQGTLTGGVERREEIMSAIDEAAATAAAELLRIGRKIWQVRQWEEWQKVAPSYEQFLHNWLGLGASFGALLCALGQAAADLTAPPLRRLEVCVAILAGCQGERSV